MTAPVGLVSALIQRLSIGWRDDDGRLHRLLIPEIVLVQAAVTGCPLEHAAVLLELESSGGRNVFSAPKDPRGMARGSLVTEETYALYLSRRAEAGPQGVGPMQLTWPALQDAADARGGAWRPEINVRVGLEVFASHLRRDSARDAYSRWNTGKPGSSSYAARALELLPGWRKVIEGVPGSSTTAIQLHVDEADRDLAWTSLTPVATGQVKPPEVSHALATWLSVKRLAP